MKEVDVTLSKLIRFGSEMAQENRNEMEITKIRNLNLPQFGSRHENRRTANFDVQEAETMQIDVVAFGFAINLSFQNVF